MTLWALDQGLEMLLHVQKQRKRQRDGGGDAAAGEAAADPG